MKIMVLGIRGMPNVQGGVETHAEQLYRRLALMGCEVEALVRTPFVMREHVHLGPIRLRRLWAPRWPGVEAFTHSLLGVFYAAVARPDILHIHAVGPSIVAPIARAVGLSVVTTHHGNDYEREKWGPLARLVLRLGERLGVRQSHACIAVSRTIADNIRANHGVNAHYIPNGVVVDPLPQGSQWSSPFGLEPDHYFLHVGRMVPEKRQLDLIAAYARRPRDWKLVLAGTVDDSNYGRAVQRAAAEAGAVLTGYLTGEPLRQLYANAGAFVLPSSHEGLPIALLEALSYGLPVLASDIRPNVEIGLEAGSYFPLGNVAALAEALTALEHTTPDRASSEARRVWVMKQFDWDGIAERTLSVYRQVSRGSGRPASRGGMRSEGPAAVDAIATVAEQAPELERTS